MTRTVSVVLILLAVLAGLSTSVTSAQQHDGKGATAPAEPRGRLAHSPSGREIRICWTDRSDNEDGFIVERKSNQPGEAFRELARVRADTYEDLTVKPGTVYVYRARAYNDHGVSTFAEAAVKAGGAPPRPTSSKIPAWNIPAKIVYSKAFPGFMDIEIYQEGGRYFVRDMIRKDAPTLLQVGRRRGSGAGVSHLAVRQFTRMERQTAHRAGPGTRRSDAPPMADAPRLQQERAGG